MAPLGERHAVFFFVILVVKTVLVKKAREGRAGMGTPGRRCARRFFIVFLIKKALVKKAIKSAFI